MSVCCEQLQTFIFVKCPKVVVHLLCVQFYAFINLDANHAFLEFNEYIFIRKADFDQNS